MWDVAIVGAGPAGASTAYFLARVGVNVVLLDRQTFPRDKVCGDGVASEGLAVLEQMGLAEWTTRGDFYEPHKLLLSGPDGSSVTMNYVDSPFSYGRVIPRRHLDDALVKQAMSVGAHLVENCYVRACERIDGKGIRVSGTSTGVERSYEARVLVLAEGSQPSLSRRLGLIYGEPDLVAVRGYFADDAQPCDTLEIHYDRSVSPGYAWIFPLGNGTANVGIGASSKQVIKKRLNLITELKRIVTENPHFQQRLKDATPQSPVKGFPLRTDLSKSRLCDDHVLVVGDTAHLVNPLTGEGIAPALVSGKLAARQIERTFQRGDFSAAAMAPYARQIKSRYGADYRAAFLIRRLLSWAAITNHIIGKARNDGELALKLGLSIIGVASPRALLKPSMIARYLF